MGAWIVRSMFVEGGKASVSPTITIKTRRSVSIKQGDAILCSEHFLGKIRFVWHAHARDITARSLREIKGDVDANLKLYSIQLTDLQTLEPARDLDALQYSMVKVRRIDRPYLHFRQPYTRVSEEDFETIIGDRVFWARTSLLRFLTALPDELRSDFMARSGSPSDLDRHFGYQKRWRDFRQFLEDSYLPLAELFRGIEEELEGLGELAPRELHFRNDAEDRADSIRAQALRFREFATSLETAKQKGVFDEIDAHIEEHAESERRFERLFATTPWPSVIRER